MDLALGAPASATQGLFFDLKQRFLPYGELATHREAMSRFGQGLKAIDAVAKQL